MYVRPNMNIENPQLKISKQRGKHQHNKSIPYPSCVTLDPIYHCGFRRGAQQKRFCFLNFSLLAVNLQLLFPMPPKKKLCPIYRILFFFVFSGPTPDMIPRKDTIKTRKERERKDKKVKEKRK